MAWDSDADADADAVRNVEMQNYGLLVGTCFQFRGEEISHLLHLVDMDC